MLILSTGGVAIAAPRIAKMSGAWVIITSSSDEKLDRARDLRADDLINYRRHSRWSEQVYEITRGRGMDHVMELGGPGTLAQSIDAVRVGGHISLIGVLTGRHGEVPTAALMANQARLQGLIVGNRRWQQDYVAALEQSGLLPVVDRSFSFGQMADAFRFQQEGSHFGNVCTEW